MQANEKRAEALSKGHKSGDTSFKECPNGQARAALHFGAEFRGETVIWQDSERRKVEGYASTVGRKYRMWDAFGEYEEVMMPGAFERTLSQSPDVAFLLNHRGVTMARTTNGSLELSSDSKGLKSIAYLNPKRTDVQDLLHAIEDKDITEMSFAFMIENGEWNDEFTEFRINEVNIDRGDVSAVNYGANPYTSVNARQQQIMSDFRQIPRAAQEAAIRGAGLSKVEEARSDSPKLDKGITDVDYLIAEQWLAQQSLRNK